MSQQAAQQDQVEKGNCLALVHSANPPAGIEETTLAPAYAATISNAYDWISSHGIMTLSRSMKGRTGAIKPYRKKPVNKSTATMAMMKTLFERRRRSMGGDKESKSLIS